MNPRHSNQEGSQRGAHLKTLSSKIPSLEETARRLQPHEDNQDSYARRTSSSGKVLSRELTALESRPASFFQENEPPLPRLRFPRDQNPIVGVTLHTWLSSQTVTASPSKNQHTALEELCDPKSLRFRRGLCISPNKSAFPSRSTLSPEFALPRSVPSSLKEAENLLCRGAAAGSAAAGLAGL